LFSPTADWLYWLLLGIVYLISEWFPLLLLLDNTLLMIITTYTMAFRTRTTSGGKALDPTV
jgi:hypothetical protein